MLICTYKQTDEESFHLWDTSYQAQLVVNFMSSKDLGRFVDYIGSAMLIGFNILSISVYQNSG